MIITSLHPLSTRPCPLGPLPILVSLLIHLLFIPVIDGLALPSVISSHLVLQRAPQQSRVWGTASPSSVVRVTLDSTSPLSTFASTEGEWQVTLPPHPPGVNHTLTIEGDDERVELINVAFGDVYLCSGQSNMEYALKDSWTGNASITDATHYPHLRLFTVAKAASLTPLTNTTSRWKSNTSWVVTSPQYLDGPSFEWFSAVCYYFGRSLYQAINEREGKGGEVSPIGLIDSCWSASLIEAWSTESGLEQCGPIRFPAYNSSLPTRSTRLGPANSTVLYNGHRSSQHPPLERVCCSSSTFTDDLLSSCVQV
jgi:sialate O-acetylesterase